MDLITNIGLSVGILLIVFSIGKNNKMPNNLGITDGISISIKNWIFRYGFK